MAKTRNAEAVRVIANLGGTNAVAKRCGLRSPSVSQWKRDGIPKAWRQLFQATDPDAFTRRPRVQRRAVAG